MSFRLFITFALCVSFISSAAVVPLKVMTYNIHNGVGLDGARDYKRIADLINNEGPDIVAIQEIDSVTERSDHTFILDSISKLTDMYASFSPAINYEGGSYGVGILSKVKPNSVVRLPLPGREEARTLLIAEFDDCYFCCTHFSLTDSDRRASAIIINGLTEMTSKPVIIAGDFNSTPDDDTIKILESSYTVLNSKSSPTFPADNPAQTIDYILISKNNDINSDAIVINESVISDHRPVIVNISNFN